MNRYFLALLGTGIVILGIIFVSANSSNPTSNQNITTSSPKNKVEIKEYLPEYGGFQGKKIAANYYEFNQKDYDLLRASKQPILLYFYANWCPTCASQEPVMKQALNEGISNGKVALRVNYSDSDTDENEKELAKTFTITYQHTFVLLDASAEEVTRVNGQQSADDLKKLFSKI